VQVRKGMGIGAGRDLDDIAAGKEAIGRVVSVAV
jgi:hypothetical protein